MTKSIVLLGATGGLGEAIIAQLANKNYTLMLIGRNEDKLKSLVQQWQDSFVKLDYSLCQLGSSNEREHLIAYLQTIEFDTLLYNAGYGLYLNAEEFSYADVEDLLQVNLLAPIHITNGLLAKLYAQQKGHIIFVASQAGKIATAKSSLYSASKFGLIGYANALRLEGKQHAVHVTTVNPGPIATNFFKRADKTGQYVKAVGKYILHVDDVAKRIAQVIERPKREVNMPKVMEFLARLYVLFPKIADHLTGGLFNKK